MKTQVFPVIVIYNRQINESLTLHSLLKCKVPTSNICILDNSTSDYGIKEFCDKIGCTYISMNGNMGLSKAYNRALEYLKQIAKLDDLVMWLDDDTEVTQEYFNVLRIEAEDCNADIFMPIIMGQDGVIYSPNEGAFMKSRFIKAVDEELDMTKINGINSCLAVRYRIYKDYRYTEELFMDLVDNQFFDDMRGRNVSFVIIRTLIHQTFFQRDGATNIDSVINRFNIRIADFMIYAKKKGKWFLLLALVKSFGWGCVSGLKFKSPKIIWACASQGFKRFIVNIC